MPSGTQLREAEGLLCGFTQPVPAPHGWAQLRYLFSEELAGITVHRQALHHHSRPYSVPSTWSCWVYQSGGAEFPAPLLWLWVHEEPKSKRNVSQEDKAYFKERGKENAPCSRLHLAFVLVVTWRKAESQPPRRLLSSETELGDVNRGEYAPHSGLWVHAGTP